jgi:hypothetical protein
VAGDDRGTRTAFASKDREALSADMHAKHLTIDKTVIAISSGTLVLSIGFVDRVAATELHFFVTLIVAWTFLIACVGIACWALRVSADADYERMRELSTWDQMGERDWSRSQRLYDRGYRLTAWYSKCAIAGIILIAVFVIRNVEARHERQAHEKAICAEAPARARGFHREVLGQQTAPEQPIEQRDTTATRSETEEEVAAPE